MGDSHPPIGPEATLRSMLLFTISGSKWDSNDDPHRNICKYFAKKLSLNTDNSQLACFMVAYPGINPHIMEARDLLSSFCNAYSFLLSLYNAMTPMEGDIPVPRRKETWQSYQSMLFHLMVNFDWPSEQNPAPEKNILEELQEIMDADGVIIHLKLSAKTLFLQGGDFRHVSHNKAEQIMSHIMKTCYPYIKLKSHNIDLIVNRIRVTENDCFLVTDLHRLLASACKVISCAVSVHIDSHRDEYDQAIAHLVSLASS
jgi:hypothetical protein